MTFNVLLSSAGRRVALLKAFRESLTRIGVTGGVFAADESSLSAAYHVADKAFLVPPCDDPGFLPHMLDLCAREKVRLLVPTIDTELGIFARARLDLERQGTTVCISSPEVVAIAADKRRTHAFLTSNGFPTVRQGEIADVERAPEAWPFPLLAKPPSGSAATGVLVVHRLSSLQDIARDHDYIVQSAAPGFEYTIDVFADAGGVPRCAVPRRRLEVRAGEVSKAVTVRSSELMDLAQSVVAKLPGAYGALNVQVFHDPETGALNVIEVNARFGGGFPLSYEAGADFPGWLIAHALDRPVDFDEGNWVSGLTMLRYDDAVFISSQALVDNS